MKHQMIAHRVKASGPCVALAALSPARIDGVKKDTAASAAARSTIRAVILASTGALAISVSGCMGDTAPFAYEHIETISRSLLQRIVDDRSTREEAIRLLGPPDATNEEVRSIGYERCKTSKGYSSTWIFVPVWVRSVEVTDCQRAGVWFDEEDRAEAWDATREKGEGVALQGSLDSWLAVPGGSRQKR